MKRWSFCACVLATGVLFQVRTVSATDIFVDDSHTSGTFDGTTWATCYQFLQDALDVATSSDVIHVGQGTYYPDLDGGFNSPSHTLGSLTETFGMKSDVTLFGGYIGFNNPSPNTRDPSVKSQICCKRGSLSQAAVAR